MFNKNIIMICFGIFLFQFSVDAEVLFKINKKIYVNSIKEENIESTQPENEACIDIISNGKSNGSGFYDITINNQKINAYCDMDTDGGGWTLLTLEDSKKMNYKNIMRQSDKTIYNEEQSNRFKYLINNNLSSIYKYNYQNNYFMPSVQASLHTKELSINNVYADKIKVPYKSTITYWSYTGDPDTIRLVTSVMTDTGTTRQTDTGNIDPNTNIIRVSEGYLNETDNGIYLWGRCTRINQSAGYCSAEIKGLLFEFNFDLPDINENILFR